MTQEEILENHERFKARTALFRKHGYDSDRANAFILSQTPAWPARALDIGSGKGRFLVALLKHSHAVTSVDIDYAEQGFARLNVAYEGLSDRVRFLQADATRLPFRDATFRTVVSVNALHHFRDWRPLLSEVVRIMHPQGTVVLADFNEKGFNVLDRLYSKEGKVHPRVIYRIRDIVQTLSSQGWRIRMAEVECQWVLTGSRFP
ncbi:MAG: class I SAM-dependent methyltransferase [Acidobacteria bacterium]|nr:MAG: class I SAM-dependent methyltransferase [Acidobacteriota bacterium]